MVKTTCYPILAMPKFAITKNGNFMTFDNKVRGADNCFIVFTISDTGIPQDFCKKVSS